MIALTYKEWQVIGWQVQYGQRSTQRNEAGQAVFLLEQVYNKEATARIVEESLNELPPVIMEDYIKDTQGVAGTHRPHHTYDVADISEEDIPF